MGGWRRRGGLKPAHVAAGGQRKGGAQQHRRSPKAPAYPSLAPSRKPHQIGYSYWSGGLAPAKQLNLPHMEHLDARSAARLDPATDTDPFIL